MANDYKYITDLASGGLNSKDDPRDLADNESPELLNMDIGSKGRAISRTGYEKWGTAISGQTGGFRGLLPYYRTYGANSGDYLLSFHSNGNGYKSTNTTPTPASIDTYGTDSGSVRGIVFNNTAIIGNGLAANSIQAWSGSGNLAALAGSPPDGKIFGVINHSLLIVGTGTRTIYWCDIDDETDWSTGIASNTVCQTKDGGDVRALLSANDQPMALAEFSKHMMDITFDSSDLLVRYAFKEKVDSSGGCCATGSAVSMVNSSGEAVFYLSAREGYQSYGSLENFSNARTPSEIGYKIKPTTDRINYSAHDVINSEVWEKKYICLAPFNNATKNNYGFVYNTEYGGWTVYTYPFADLKRFRDSFGRDQLILASNGDPQLFKANKSFSDDGFGYERVYRSKTHDYGGRVRFDWVDFEGSKVLGKDIEISVYIDGRVEKRKVTDDNLIVGTGGGYVADNWVGDNYVGGAAGNLGTPMYRWRGRFKIQNYAEGQQIYWRSYNNSDGGGYAMQGYGIKIKPVSNEIARNTQTGEGGYLSPIV